MQAVKSWHTATYMDQVGIIIKKKVNVQATFDLEPLANGNRSYSYSTSPQVLMSGKIATINTKSAIV
jgi:hypothetical protein